MAQFDFAVVGSGFGGAVAALRLSQKGYRVVVLEMGRRWAAEDFPASNWDAKRYLWMPRLGLRGLQRMQQMRHMLAVGGVGVGGGSLIYGNTLFVPGPRFFATPVVQALGGEATLMPYFELAKKMMGVVPNPLLTDVDRVLAETAADYGRGATFTPSPVGVFFGEAGKSVPDPYFHGEGPARAGCTGCGRCFIGCPERAKNTLDLNYLFLAERLGAEIRPDTEVVRLLPRQLGKAGWDLETRSPRAPGSTVVHAQRVVLAAGVLGTVRLLLEGRRRGDLPSLSERIGRDVRTNSESILGLRTRSAQVDLSKGLAASASVFPDEHTQVQADRYPAGSDLMALLSTLLVDGGGVWPRPLRWLAAALRHPLDLLRGLWPRGFAQRSALLIVMQDLDSSLRLVLRRGLFGRRLASLAGGGSRAPTYIALGNDFARRMARRLDAVPLSSLSEVLLDAPATAHILGGCIIGRSAHEGVVDLDQRVFGYEGLWVCDGSVMPVNLGVNPALSILALTERAMARVEPRVPIRHLAVDRMWCVEGILNP